MFQKVTDASFIKGEHEILKFWEENQTFDQLRRKNQGKPKWSFIDGPMTANNPMGVHHAWGRTYKDAYQRYYAMTGHELRLGYWMDWDNPDELRKLAEYVGKDTEVTMTAPSGKQITDKADMLVSRLGNSEWGGSYFTFSTENNETIWTFLTSCPGQDAEAVPTVRWKSLTDGSCLSISRCSCGSLSRIAKRNTC